jgi:hypothetical protein
MLSFICFIHVNRPLSKTNFLAEKYGKTGFFSFQGREILVLKQLLNLMPPKVPLVKKTSNEYNLFPDSPLPLAKDSPLLASF